MNNAVHRTQFQLEPVDNTRLKVLFGQGNNNIKFLEHHLGVEILNRGHYFEVSGEFKRQVLLAQKILIRAYKESLHYHELTVNQLQLWINGNNTHDAYKTTTQFNIQAPLITIKPHGLNQQKYVQNIEKHAINFGIGPAGTGKTFLAVACAVQALHKQTVRRLVLVRPAVEAGEKLGFLPGDLAQKVDPYLRPIYDALYETLGIEQVNRHIASNIIEIAPLAYMRGRTLSDAFVILDESQNTTHKQMKMFLTRIGFGSTAVITGDITQNDLPDGHRSGLAESIDLLSHIEGISFTFFKNQDIVRHPIVQKIVQAYEEQEAQEFEQRAHKNGGSP